MKKKLIIAAILYFLMVTIPFSVVSSHHGEPKSEKKRPSESVETATPYVEENIKKVELKNYTDYDKFNILDTSQDKIITVTNKEFLIGGTAAEVPQNFDEEAIKAQMIAAYTYYSRQRLSNRKGDKLDYDFPNF